MCVQAQTDIFFKMTHCATYVSRRQLRISRAVRSRKWPFRCCAVTTLLHVAPPLVKAEMASESDPEMDQILGKKQPRVALIGSGIAGLQCASDLASAGFTNFVILEATDRIGGRIHSIDLGEFLGSANVLMSRNKQKIFLASGNGV